MHDQNNNFRDICAGKDSFFLAILQWRYWEIKAAKKTTSTLPATEKKDISRDSSCCYSILHLCALVGRHRFNNITSYILSLKATSIFGFLPKQLHVVGRNHKRIFRPNLDSLLVRTSRLLTRSFHSTSK